MLSTNIGTMNVLSKVNEYTHSIYMDIDYSITGSTHCFAITYTHIPGTV